ncbi:hypothetical protein LP420_29080 [Massilia sp. B-10]|nr:hypothetical protein LP420_29080 [Massilia sp. B-10]
MRLEQSQQSAPPVSDWLRGTAVAGGAVLASALLDKPVDRFAARHQDARFCQELGQLRKKYADCAGGHGLHVAATMGDERMQNTGIIALQSVAASLGVTVAGKYVVRRARPEEGRGPWAQVGDGYRRSDAAFPLRPQRHRVCSRDAVCPGIRRSVAVWRRCSQFDGAGCRTQALGVRHGGLGASSAIRSVRCCGRASAICAAKRARA